MNELWLAAAIIVYENGEYFMKPIGVVTDSHSGISPEEAEQLGVKVLPMPFYVDNRCCYEGVTFTREEFLEKLKNGAKVSTSQPSPLEVMKFWDEALTEFEQIIYIPISSGLSGSCSTASMLASDEKYENKVFVVDNGRVSAPLRRSVLDALELIEKGYVAPCRGRGPVLLLPHRLLRRREENDRPVRGGGEGREPLQPRPLRPDPGPQAPAGDAEALRPEKAPGVHAHRG